MPFPTIPTTGAGTLVGNNQLNTTATRTFPAWSGVTHGAGDRVIAVVLGYQSSTTDAQFSSWSHSFTEIHDTGTSTTLAIGVAYKDLTGTESGSLTVTQAATITGDASMILLVIPAGTFDPSVAPIVGARVSGTTSAANPASLAPGLGALDFLWIAIAASGMTATTSTWTATGTTAPANYGSRFDTNASDTSTIGDAELAVAFRQLNASAEDVGTAGVDTSNARNAALVIAIAPPEVVQVDVAPPAAFAQALSVAITSLVTLEITPYQATALSHGGVPEVAGAPPVEITHIAASALGFGAAPTVNAQTIISLVPTVGIAVSAAATPDANAQAIVSLSPTSGFAPVHATDAIVSFQAIVSLTPASGIAIAVSAISQVGVTSGASLTPTPAIGLSLGSSPQAVSLAVVSITSPTGMVIAVAGDSILTAGIAVNVDPPAGIVAGFAASPSLTVAVVVSLTPTPGIGLSTASPAGVVASAGQVLTPSPGIGLALSLAITSSAIITIMPPATRTVAFGTTVSVGGDRILTSMPGPGLAWSGVYIVENVVTIAPFGTGVVIAWASVPYVQLGGLELLPSSGIIIAFASQATMDSTYERGHGPMRSSSRHTRSAGRRGVKFPPRHR